MKGKKMKKTVVYGVAALSLVMVGALIATRPSGTARADEPASSTLAVGSDIATGQLVDETVYVFLNADGGVRKTISSDWTKNDLGADVYKKTEGKVSTPISVKISYYLDGVKVSAEELRGRSGHVKIRYDYTNTERVNGYYMPYAVLSGVVLSNERFSNVTATNGKLMNDGSRTAVVGMTLPGMRENLGVSVDLPEYFEIEADVKEFKMEMTATIATSKIFAEIDTSALNSVEALSTQLNTLASSMEQLMDGSAQLRDGLGALNDKTGILADGILKLQSGSTQLASGAQKVADGALSAFNGAKQLDAGIDLTINKVSQLKGGLAELDKNSETIAGGVQTLINGTLAELKQNPALASITIENYQELLTAVIKNLKLAGDNETAVRLENVAEQIGLYQGILAYVAGASKIAAAASQADLAELKNGSSQLVAGLSELSTGAGGLADGMTNLDDGLSSLASNIPALSSGISQLADGSKSLTDGLALFNEQGVQRLIALYNGDVRALVARIQNIVDIAKNAPAVKYIYRTPEI